MRLSPHECRTTKLAIELILNRKRVITPFRPSEDTGIQSLFVELPNLEHDNKDLSGFIKNQIINAITKPLAYIFFLSHRATDKNAVEELASYIENNTHEMSIWYEVGDES